METTIGCRQDYRGPARGLDVNQLSQSAYISDWESTSFLSNTTPLLRHTRTHAQELSVKQGRRRDVCVFILGADGWIPWLADKFGMAHGPVFKCISYTVMVSQSVCLSVCLSDCLPSEDTLRPASGCKCVWADPERLLSAKNKHTPRKCGATR